MSFITHAGEFVNIIKNASEQLFRLLWGVFACVRTFLLDFHRIKLHLVEIDALPAVLIPYEIFGARHADLPADLVLDIHHALKKQRIEGSALPV